MQTVQINKKTITEVLSYLGTRPYAEVALLIGKLANEIRTDEQKGAGEEKGQ